MGRNGRRPGVPLRAAESGFYPLPALLRTWAPAAQTPVIRRKLSREHLSAISAISITGELYWSAQDRPYKSTDAIGFLQRLLDAIPGKLLVIGDGAPIHRGRAVREFRSRGAARRLQPERLPGYAPELNPDEVVWRYWKRVELRNVVCADLAGLREAFVVAVARLRGKPEAL